MPEFIPANERACLFAALRSGLDWRTEQIRLFGRTVTVPRLVAWYGDAGADYVYSGTLHRPLPWHPVLAELRDRVAARAGAGLNSVLANLYRSGADSMGWHADDEPELGATPLIASLSLGTPRRFCLRPKPGVAGRRSEIVLADGSLLLMRGTTLARFLHSLPKAAGVVGERINLTFRQVIPATPA